MKASEKDFPPNLTDLSNESDVEQFFITPLLKGPYLGYKTSQIRTKTNIRKLLIGKGTSKKNYYPDYLIMVESIPYFVIEAKNPEENLNSASHEGRLYASEVNALYPQNINPCKYVVTSNGEVTELFNWDSSEPLLSLELSDFNMQSQKFQSFVEALAIGVAIDSLNKIKHHIFPIKGTRPITLLGGNLAQSDRVDPNQFGQILVNHYEELFNPTASQDRENVVINAYVNSKRKERYFDEIDRVVDKSAVFSSIPGSTIDNTENPTELIQQFDDPRSLSNQILLLVGARGTGKSTFVDYLQYIKLNNTKRKDLVWVRIDFNNSPREPEELNSWVRKSIISELTSIKPELEAPSLDLLKRLFNPEIKKNLTYIVDLYGEESPQYKEALQKLINDKLNDENILIKAYEKYVCSGLGKLLVIACDNCDKRESNIQLITFETIRWIKSQIRCLVLLPIRDITYQSYYNKPPLDTAIKSLTFLITPPPFQKILMKRIDFLIKTASINPPKNISYYTENGTQVVFDSEKITTFLRSINEAFFTEQTKLGKRILQGISGKNVRKGIEMFLSICKSGYLPESEIFGLSAGGSENPFTESLIYNLFLRTDRKYYSGDNSYVTNLYGALDSKPRIDHFLRYHILYWLEMNKDDVGPTGYRGLHHYSKLIENIEVKGYSLETIEDEFKYLEERELVYAESEVGGNSEVLISLSSSGSEHLQLAKSMNYLAACAEDSFIGNTEVLKKVASRLKNKPTRGKTVMNAIDFGDYIKTESDQVNSRDICASPEYKELANFLTSLEQAKKTNDSYRNHSTTSKIKKTKHNKPIISNIRDTRTKGDNF